MAAAEVAAAAAVAPAGRSGAPAAVAAAVVPAGVAVAALASLSAAPDAAVAAGVAAHGAGVQHVPPVEGVLALPPASAEVDVTPGRVCSVSGTTRFASGTGPEPPPLVPKVVGLAAVPGPDAPGGDVVGVVVTDLFSGVSFALRVRRARSRSLHTRRQRNSLLRARQGLVLRQRVWRNVGLQRRRAWRALLTGRRA